MSTLNPPATESLSRVPRLEVWASVLLTAAAIVVAPVDRWFGARLYGLHHQLHLGSFLILVGMSLSVVSERLLRLSIGAVLLWGVVIGYTSSVLAYAAVPFWLLLLQQRLLAFFFDSPRAFAAVFVFPLVSLQWAFGMVAAWLFWCLTAKAAIGRRRTLVLGSLLLLIVLRALFEVVRL